MPSTATHPFDRLRARYMAVVGLAVFLVLAIAGGIVMAIAELPAESLNDAWAYTLVFGVLCPVLAWWGARRGLDVRRVFGPFPRDAAAWGASFAPLLAVMGVATLLMVALGIWSYVSPERALGLVNNPAIGGRDPFGEQAGTVAAAVAAVLVAPLAEEFVFRGLLMQRWMRKWGMWGGVLASSAVFGALHLTYAPLAFLTGLLLALLYVATGSLWVPIAGHALNNAFVTALDLMPDRGGETITLTELRGGMVASVLFAAICGVALYRLRAYVWPSPDSALPYGTVAAIERPVAAPGAESSYLIVLRPVRPEMLTEGPTDAEEEAIERHYARLKELAREGRVSVAGRTTRNDGRTMGIILVSASSEEEARAIMAEDPAVRAGVMTGELHPFRVAVRA